MRFLNHLYFSPNFDFLGTTSLPPRTTTTTTTIKKLSKVLIVDEKLSSITNDGEGLLKRFWFLKINKGHGGGNGYISMLKICDSSIVKPLSLIFENFLRIAISQKLSSRKTQKISNTVLIVKSNDKQIIKNHSFA